MDIFSSTFLSLKTNTEHWKEGMDPIYFPDWERFQMFGREIDYTHLGEEVIRAYSMASYPAEGRKLMFNIRIATPPLANGKVADNIPWGICSSYTFSLKPGDTVSLSGPYGESFMKNDERELVFLIGGAGSSFGRAHIMHLFRTENTKRKVTLWYGARSLKENIYQEEYEALEREFRTLSIIWFCRSPFLKILRRDGLRQTLSRQHFCLRHLNWVSSRRWMNLRIASFMCVDLHCITRA